MDGNVGNSTGLKGKIVAIPEIKATLKEKDDVVTAKVVGNRKK